MVLGSGGREHALAWKLSQSRNVEQVFVGPGNAGTGACAADLPQVKPSDFPSISDACRTHHIDCVFIGPEVPLADGVVDFLRAQKIPAIGPEKSSARLESSKAFSKSFMKRNGLPTAKAEEFSDAPSFERSVRGLPGKRLVVKKSGLAAGKGVLESSRTDELIHFGLSILQTDRLLVEEFLEGWEVSIFGLSDGRDFVILPPCTDFKKAREGDQGPNTGGMGSICPVPWVDAPLMDRISTDVIEPTYAALAREGLSYVGVLYFGLMITAQGPKILEFNARFGDPETQVLMPMLGHDLGALVEAMAAGTLRRYASQAAPPAAAPAAALGVVVASRGYPDNPEKGALVDPLPAPPAGDAMVFHAGTTKGPNNDIRTGGGRCFTAVGTGRDLPEASRNAYKAADTVRFDGAWYRRDIGRKFFGGRI
jgi:phosphoribosylamine--glycine ligase